MGISVEIRTRQTRHKYNAEIATGSLAKAGDWAARSLTRRDCKIAILTNRKIAPIYLDLVKNSIESAGFKVFPFVLPDGERYKNFQSLTKLLQHLGEKQFQRTDAIVSLGGGVIGDIAGFASAVYLRGIDFLQIPTTLLAMIDSSVGGKTGINTPFGKNLVGAFNQPRGVLIDAAVLHTLDRREITAGLCEAVKQAALAGGNLFEQTSELLDILSGRAISEVFPEKANATKLERFIAAHIRFKSRIVSADEREQAAGSGPKSRKILNFGHTFAHALEKSTNYRYLRHGEAVGHGILFAADLSKRLELIDKDSVNLLNDVVHRCGSLPPIGHIAPEAIREALRYDKKNIDGTLQWILLEQIGKPRIIPGNQIPTSVLNSTIKAALRK